MFVGPLLSIQFVGLVVCVALYYKAAEMDNQPAWLWMGLSAGLYVLMWRCWGYGWLVCVAGQLVLGLLIGVYRAVSEGYRR